MLQPRGYSVLGHHITDSTQTALSIVGIISRIATFVFAVPGGMLGDRFGRLQVIRVTALFGSVLPPLVWAYTDSFELVLLVAGLSGIVGGLGSPNAAALNADVLPTDSDNAARDMQLISATPSLVPGIVLPYLVGNALAWFPSHRAAYHVLFTAAAAVYAVSVCVLFGIRLEGDGVGKQRQETKRLAVKRMEDYRKQEEARMAKSRTRSV